MTIDLDTTDYGHAVGEVEIIVSNPNNINNAKERINQFVQLLLLQNNNFNITTTNATTNNKTTTTTSMVNQSVLSSESESTIQQIVSSSTPTSTAIGKVEYYIQKYRPQLYNELIQSGVLRY
jgi:beta-mannanase